MTAAVGDMLSSETVQDMVDGKRVDPARLPRLLYVGEVPIENSYHGSSLLYRLLLNYPAERLRIVEVAHASLPERRLPGVDYCYAPDTLSRIQRTRWAQIAASATLLTETWRIGAVRKAIGPFEADAVLTVTHGNAWINAATIARERGLPLHLICHDEWARTQLTLPQLEPWKQKVFARLYRQASTRLCVSPAMADDYSALYGAPGTILYPARSYQAPVYHGVSPRLTSGAGGRTFAFAGSMNTIGMVAANARLAAVLAPLGGKLVIYGPATRETQPELDLPNIEFRGLLTPNALSDALRTEIDYLFLPMWSEPKYHDNMRLSFPSKLTDYCNVGLPILATGPDYCSAVQWERSYPGVAAVVTDETPEALRTAVTRLFEDRPRTLALAERAKTVGDQLFHPRAAEETFFSALQRGATA